MNTFAAVVNFLKESICNIFSGKPNLTGPVSGPVQELMNSGFTREKAELYVRGWRPVPDKNGIPSWDHPVQE
jgi:hypothetical protein